MGSGEKRALSWKLEQVTVYVNETIRKVKRDG